MVGVASDALGLAPAAEDQAAERKAESERPNPEGADCGGFAPGRQALPAAEGFLLFVGQRLTAALFA
jgi:hypothetical protein